MVVVIGVKALQDAPAEFSLVMNGPDKVTYQITQMSTNNAEEATVAFDSTRSADNPYVQVYKWYNWGHGDFRIEVKTRSGEANFYLNRVSETDYQENAFSAIGLNAFNSAWTAQLTANSEVRLADISEIKLTREDTMSVPQFCYNCWYFISVIVDQPEEVEYYVWVQRLEDTGSELPEMLPNTVTNFNMLDKGVKSRNKFMLETRDSFELQVEVTSGEVLVNIGIDPDNIDEAPLWSLVQGVGNGSIDVGSADINFHIGTWYYISIEQLSTQSALGNLKLNQLKKVQFLANGVPSKLQFIYDRELVKLAVF